MTVLFTLQKRRVELNVCDKRGSYQHTLRSSPALRAGTMSNLLPQYLTVDQHLTPLQACDVQILIVSVHSNDKEPS